MLTQLQLHALVQLRCPNCACTATKMVLVTPFGSPVMSLLGYLVLATTWFCWLATTHFAHVTCGNCNIPMLLVPNMQAVARVDALHTFIHSKCSQ